MLAEIMNNSKKKSNYPLLMVQGQKLGKAE